MNKKLVALASATLLAASVFVGCGKSASGMKDGTYKAEYDNVDTKGWKAYVELKVAKGKITEATYDYVNANNELKTADKKYEEAMKGKSGTYPAKYTEELEKALVEKQDVTKVDKVTGATSSSDHFKSLAEAAIKNANEGKTEVTKLPQPDVKK